MYAGGAPMPWQHDVACVLGERDPDTGARCYREAVIVVGRRAGKTRITHGIPLWRGLEALSRPVRHPLTGKRVPYLAASTAQNHKAAGRRLAETWANVVAAAPALQSSGRYLRGENYTAIELAYRTRAAGRWQTNPFSSRLAVFPPVPHAVLGDEYLWLAIDESRTLTMADGQDLLEAASPTLTTYDGLSQLVWLSNEAKGAGGWLSELKERGRAAVRRGDTDGLAYFEFAMERDDDVEDPAVWRRVHPALGHVLSEAALAKELHTLGADAFAREYLCLEDEATSDAPINAARWTELTSDGDWPDGVHRWLGVDVSPDRWTAAIAGAARGRDGTVRVELLWHGPGSQVADEVIARRRPTGTRLGGVRLAPSQADVTARLVAAGVPAETVTPTGYAHACQRLADLVRDGRLTHPEQPDVARALAAGRRSWRDAAWTWAARVSDADITPAVALTLAAAAADDSRPGPVVRSRGRDTP